MQSKVGGDEGMSQTGLNHRVGLETMDNREPSIELREPERTKEPNHVSILHQ